MLGRDRSSVVTAQQPDGGDGDAGGDVGQESGAGQGGGATLADILLETQSQMKIASE